ncbi:MAG: DUF86 domain-containing protein [Lachnospiraceae bacterium]|nr:DUF86 domain-containing protein [Lachnospiraceae bacterium]
MQSPDIQKLSHIFDYCQEIEKTVERYGNSFEVFDKDVDYQRSVAFCILQIGELSGGLSAEYRAATTNSMPWTAIKGMRNFVAHNYGNMSREIIWETVTHDIPLLRDFCQKQLKDD